MGQRMVVLVGAVAVLGCELVALASWQGWWPRGAADPRGTTADVAALAATAANAPSPVPVVAPADPGHPDRRAPRGSGATVAAAAAADALTPDASPAAAVDADTSRAGIDRFAALRSRLRWIPARVGEATLATLDLPSRLLLAQSAAREARLHEVGLGFQDVYGVIHAETHWVPRTGASRDGTPNLGIAQFESATALALGLHDPDDAVEAVHAAARHLRDAAAWSATRIAGLKLDRQERAARLREGVSVYYNLSSRGRAAWDGSNADSLPAATSTHIRHAREGAAQAVVLEAQLRGLARLRAIDRSPAAVATAEAGPAR